MGNSARYSTAQQGGERDYYVNEPSEPAGPLIVSMIPWILLVWGIAWVASLFGLWAKIPVAVGATAYFYFGLPAPFIPLHQHVTPPLGNFLFTLMGLGAWAVSLWILF